jgi:hypothetical protein
VAKEQARGWFPIMGYSYYEYAGSLIRHNDSISALIFSEYALELGNIEMYFPKKDYWLYLPRIDGSTFLLAASSFLTGLLVGILILVPAASRIINRKEHKIGKNKKDKIKGEKKPHSNRR